MTGVPSPLEHASVVNTTMHIDVHSLPQAPAQHGEAFTAHEPCGLYRVFGPLAAAAESLGRQRGARRDRLAPERAAEQSEERLRGDNRVEVQPERI